MTKLQLQRKAWERATRIRETHEAYTRELRAEERRGYPKGFK